MISLFFVLLLVTLLISVLLVTRFDIMSPTSLLLVGYIIGVVSFMFMQKKWALYLDRKVFLLEFIGIISFAICAYFSQKIAEIDYIGKDNLTKEQSWIIVENNQLIYRTAIIIVILQLISTYLLYQELKAISGTGNLATIISSYRDNLIETSSAMTRISSTTSLTQKILGSFSFILIFYYFYQRIILKGKTSVILLVPTLFVVVQQILMGGRLQLFRLVIMTLFIYYILIRVKTEWSISEVKRIVKIAVGIILISVPLFYALKFVLGRSSTEGLWDYVFRYLGGVLGHLLYM
ncbi:hypothetical protein CG419_02680 [Latilactobacillus curvatus]|uniref:Oligosaccharide repeat unit polymerase n=1 Tax=Latilactobacillus curvatus TaxID=28038 RepID=A0AAC9UNQ2_LATCU|nr:hypothetical protein CG419_02680 [Latilactobacillus curvatus]